MSELTQSRLKQLFRFDQDTGMFTRLISVSTNTKAGDIAGSRHIMGYYAIRVDGKPYLSHRLAWLYTYGRFPVDEIDHINGIKSDNRIENLREATRAGNGQNLAKSKANTSGLTGVCWDKRNNKWMASIMSNYKNIFLGRFDSREKAYSAYCAAKEKYHRFSPKPQNQSAAAVAAGARTNYPDKVLRI